MNPVPLSIAELLNNIYSYLTAEDICNMFLTCKSISITSRLIRPPGWYQQETKNGVTRYSPIVIGLQKSMKRAAVMGDLYLIKYFVRLYKLEFCKGLFSQITTVPCINSNGQVENRARHPVDIIIKAAKFAAYSGRTETLQYLLSLILPMIIDNHRLNGIAMASGTSGCQETIDLVLDAGADINPLLVGLLEKGHAQLAAKYITSNIDYKFLINEIDNVIGNKEYIDIIGSQVIQNGAYEQIVDFLNKYHNAVSLKFLMFHAISANKIRVVKYIHQQFNILPEISDPWDIAGVFGHNLIVYLSKYNTSEDMRNLVML